MGFKDFHLTLVKSLGLGRFLKRDGGGPRKKKGKAGNNNTTTGKKRPSWLTPVSHGYHAVEGRSPTAGGWAEDEAEVVVQREEVEECEWWFYGVLHARIGAGVTEYLQDHLFNGKLKESQMRLKSKETMKKAHLKARTKITMETETPEKERHRNLGSASAIVINGERLVIANMGDYKAVICNDGVAFPVGTRRHKNCWSCKLFPGAVRNPRMHGAAPDATRNADRFLEDSRSSELAVMSERIDGNTELVILASSGVWEVMKEQEAVNLIRHIEDPKEAAECLAKEASTRMSRSKIACLIIRFD